jgi:uncharacterized protein (TIGR00375 family)
VSYVADLHVHSSYAFSTSRDLNFDTLARWARIKGIDLLASADFTHPVWFREARSKLHDTDDGLFEYKGVRFVLGTEVSCIGRQAGKHRRVHLLVFAPSLDTVGRINAALASRGKLESDGRPTLHMLPRELVSTLLDLDPRCIVIPAHAWTPWFGVYGSRSGFDSLDECFGDTASHVHAIETGLSSDPAMNWRVPELDGRSIVSFSDAHSAQRLGRELTVFQGEQSYAGLADALKNQRIEYTVEFFPEEGKYHHSGHRRCDVRRSPSEVLESGAACPVCGRRLTLGVMQRVEELARRNVEARSGGDGLIRASNGRPPFRSMVSLAQVLSEALGRGIQTKTVRARYDELIAELGNELSVLVSAPVSDIERVAGERTAEGVERVRRGEVAIEPGFDGRYGKVAVWPEQKL